MSAMPLAHDAATLDEIAANSAIATRALVCEKLGRNDVDISFYINPTEGMRPGCTVLKCGVF